MKFCSLGGFRGEWGGAIFSTKVKEMNSRGRGEKGAPTFVSVGKGHEYSRGFTGTKKGSSARQEAEHCRTSPGGREATLQQFPA